MLGTQPLLQFGLIKLYKAQFNLSPLICVLLTHLSRDCAAHTLAHFSLLESYLYLL